MAATLAPLSAVAAYGGSTGGTPTTGVVRVGRPASAARTARCSGRSRGQIWASATGSVTAVSGQGLSAVRQYRWTIAARRRARNKAQNRQPARRGSGPLRADLGISDAELARRYQAGESIRQLAASLGTYCSVVQYRLKAEGTQLRSANGRPPLVPAARLPPAPQDPFCLPKAARPSGGCSAYPAPHPPGASLMNNHHCRPGPEQEGSDDVGRLDHSPCEGPGHGIDGSG